MTTTSVRTRYRITLAVVGSVMLLILALLPFAITSALGNALALPAGLVFPISTAPRNTAAASHTDLHLTVISLDAVQQLATVRVSGRRACQTDCDGSYRVLLYSLTGDAIGGAGNAPSASVSLASSSAPVNQTVQLPARGQPIRYPFDVYTLRLGVAVQRVQQDGAQQTLTPAEAAGQIVMTVQADLPGLTLVPPVRADHSGVRAETDPSELLYVAQLELHRPPYLWMLTILLVTLAAASAAYTVFMRPLPELVASSGGVILGLWGIRSVLTAGGPSIVTAVDLSLSAVILFLLGAITARTLWLVFRRSELALFHRRPHP